MGENNEIREFESRGSHVLQCLKGRGKYTELLKGENGFGTVYLLSLLKEVPQSDSSMREAAYNKGGSRVYYTFAERRRGK